MSLSILIPVYNFNVTPLVKELLFQCQELNIEFEIRCYDDCSNDSFKQIHEPLKDFPHVIFKFLEKNIGRSRIRNKLAKEALYNYLLFLDCDSKILNKNFIKDYLGLADASTVVVGGRVYSLNCPDPSYILRWKYGIKREAKSAEERSKDPYEGIAFNNIFIPKKIYLSFPLDEAIRTYGHEDTKFGYELSNHKIPIKHINNPTEHLDLETHQIFLEKTNHAVINFHKIVSQQDLGKNTKIFKAYSFLKKYKLKKIFLFTYSFFDKTILENLLSINPSLFLFDLYKLQIFCKQESIGS